MELSIRDHDLDGYLGIETGLVITISYQRPDSPNERPDFRSCPTMAVWFRRNNVWNLKDGRQVRITMFNLN